jgi:hypothetical protein
MNTQEQQGRAAYAKDVLERPTYHDKTPRKTWGQLPLYAKISWFPEPQGKQS